MLIEEVLQDCQKVKIGKWLGFQAILCKSIKIKIMAIIAKTSMIGKKLQLSGSSACGAK